MRDRPWTVGMKRKTLVQCEQRGTAGVPLCIEFGRERRRGGRERVPSTLHPRVRIWTAGTGEGGAKQDDSSHAPSAEGRWSGRRGPWPPLNGSPVPLTAWVHFSTIRLPATRMDARAHPALRDFQCPQPAGCCELSPCRPVVS